MKPEPGSESEFVDATLEAWRRKAADILLAANAAVHLPAIALAMLDYGPPLNWLVKAVCMTAYLAMVASALVRRVGYRTRLAAYFGSAYVVIAAGNLVDPSGTYAKVGLVANPILALVLWGSSAGWIVILASAVVLVCAPFLRVMPGVARALVLDPAQVAAVLYQGVALAAFLAALMIVLNRFHRFLLDALAAQFRATSEVKLEMGERQRLEREIAAVADGERRRLGHELHDGVCQQVTAALLHCQVLGRRVKSGGALIDSDLQAISSMLSETIADARNIARGLCPFDNDPEALASALRALARRTNDTAVVRCEFTASGDVRVPDPVVAQHLYRIAQEALNNAVRHAHAGRISIELFGSAEELALRVEDDGAGLPAELPPVGMGLRTMAYRAQILGGELRVAPAPRGGTRVTCRVARAAGAPAPPDHLGEKRWIPTV
ncbi:MAG: sensor histidine kinase [Acidobacteriia bacterium]|nr:sensor histidine kinase [Terriglobia bacterium]